MGVDRGVIKKIGKFTDDEMDLLDQANIGLNGLGYIAAPTLLANRAIQEYKTESKRHDKTMIILTVIIGIFTLITMICTILLVPKG